MKQLLETMKDLPAEHGCAVGIWRTVDGDFEDVGRFECATNDFIALAANYAKAVEAIKKACDDLSEDFIWDARNKLQSVLDEICEPEEK